MAENAARCLLSLAEGGTPWLCAPIPCFPLLSTPRVVSVMSQLHINPSTSKQRGEHQLGRLPGHGYASTSPFPHNRVVALTWSLVSLWGEDTFITNLGTTHSDVVINSCKLLAKLAQTGTLQLPFLISVVACSSLTYARPP